jgi:hypothetical protein
VPENWFAVRRALLEAGRADLIGMGPDCLIPAAPPPEALAARREAAERAARRAGAQAPDDLAEEGVKELGEAGLEEPAAQATYVHAPAAGTSPRAEPRPEGPPPAPPASPRSVGYRPHRKGAPRRRPSR